MDLFDHHLQQLLYFAFKAFTLVPALGLSVLMTATALASANAVSTAVAYGHPGRWKLAIAALVLGAIPLNILQTVATGVGVEVFNNQAELVQLEAGRAADRIVTQKEARLKETKTNLPNDIRLCQQERQALEAMPRSQVVEEKTFQSRYVRIFGTFKSQSQPITLPLEQLPLCIRANRLEANYTKQIDEQTIRIAQLKERRQALGNDLTFLREIAPEQYDKTFIEVKPWFSQVDGETEIEIRSGIKLVTLGTENFLGKIQRGDWQQLGMNLFFVGLSAITSVASIGMGVTFALSRDTQHSYDVREKEKVDRWFKQMRVALSALHDEQLQQLENSDDNRGNDNELSRYN